MLFKDELTVCLPVGADKGEVYHFYKDYMTLKAEGENRFKIGATGYIELVPAGEAPPGPTQLWIEANNVNQVYEAMKDNRELFELISPLQDKYYHAREFQIGDPAGNIICIINYEKDVEPYKCKALPEDYFRDEFRIVLFVKNLGACHFFYQDILGLECVYQWEESPGDKGYKYALGPESHSYIEILFREPLRPLLAGSVKLKTDNLKACYHSLSSRKKDLAYVEKGKDGGFIRLCDPDGNLVVIHE